MSGCCLGRSKVLLLPLLVLLLVDVLDLLPLLLMLHLLLASAYIVRVIRSLLDQCVRSGAAPLTRFDCVHPLLLRLVAAGLHGGTRGHKANVVRVVLGRNYGQVAHEQTICVPLTLEELAVVLDIVDAGEDLLEVSQTELLLLKVQDQLQIFFCH